VRAVTLGHPLIAEDRRVANDVDVGPPGTFLLVTGSNMSGKSTLLRAIGLNVLLAQAGGPVCASSLSLPPVSVETSMRIHDSLEEGVSYFMAALRRLREIVEAVRAAEHDGRRVLYLLDEILQGTNTAERQVATRAIIGALQAHGAIGVVTTHDLSLVDAPELSASSRPVHFSERIGDRDDEVAMSFDYRLRPGLATSRNALQLMKMIGLDPSALRK
jgi:DNA mismatch repair ATPase MutS